MRVGMICPYSLSVPGGVQGQVLGLSRALRDAGHMVRIVAPCDGPPPDSNVTVVGTADSPRKPGTSFRPTAKISTLSKSVTVAWGRCRSMFAVLRKMTSMTVPGAAKPLSCIGTVTARRPGLRRSATVGNMFSGYN